MTWLRNNKGEPYSASKDYKETRRAARNESRGARNEKIKNALKGKTTRSARADAERRFW